MNQIYKYWQAYGDNLLAVDHGEVILDDLGLTYDTIAPLITTNKHFPQRI